MEGLSILKAVFLGVVQGATEFLPVSSSGHLVIIQQLLGVKLENGGLVAFDVCLHIGTLVAVIAVFWRDILDVIVSPFKNAASDVPTGGGLSVKDSRKLGLYIIVGTIPAGVLGMLFKDFFESLFTSAADAAWMLLVTGVILFFTRFAKDKDRKLSNVGVLRILGIGFAQAVAIIPGISRSGSTISGGMYLGLNKEFAARFSFLLSIPIIGVASALQFKNFMMLSNDILVAVIAGTVVAAVVGFVCIKWLLGIVKRGHFSWFAYYCWAAGLATLMYLHLR